MGPEELVQLPGCHQAWEGVTMPIFFPALACHPFVLTCPLLPLSLVVLRIWERGTLVALVVVHCDRQNQVIKMGGGWG